MARTAAPAVCVRVCLWVKLPRLQPSRAAVHDPSATFQSGITALPVIGRGAGSCSYQRLLGAMGGDEAVILFQERARIRNRDAASPYTINSPETSLPPQPLLAHSIGSSPDPSEI
jgi:hypothetical protein